MNLFAQTAETTSLDGGTSSFWLLVIFTLFVLVVVGMWKIFEKASEPGWKSIVPFLNTYTLFRIAGRNGWGFLLLLVPVVNVVVSIMIAMDLAKHFGKSTAFGVVGLWLFSGIGYIMLGFGDAQYVGVKHQ